MRNVESDGLTFIYREKLASPYHIRAPQKVPLRRKEKIIKRITKKTITKEISMLNKILN